MTHAPLLSLTRPQAHRQGFTMIEILIVVAILGILATIGMMSFMPSLQRGRDSRRKTDLSQVKTALQVYYSDFQKYPGAAADGRINGCVGGTVTCDWGAPFSATVNGQSRIYMKQLPEPMGSTGEIMYAQTGGDQTYLLSTVIENESDPDITQSATRCNTTPLPLTYFICPS